MGTSNSQQKTSAVQKLVECGAECVKKEDRSGQTRSGWFIDDVYLGPASDPSRCVQVMLGN